jgi:hypothetical protein
MSLFRNTAGPVLFAAVFVAGAAQSQDLTSAHHFVASIYGHYPISEKRPAFDPLAGGLERALFDASLVQLINEDRRLAKGEVGTLDGDPFCDCQDDGGTSFTVGPGRAAGADAAVVEVVRRGPDQEKPETITLDLVSTPAGWRVHDIRTPDTPSLRRMLEDGNRALKKLK